MITHYKASHPLTTHTIYSSWLYLSIVFLYKNSISLHPLIISKTYSLKVQTRKFDMNVFVTLKIVSNPCFNYP